LPGYTRLLRTWRIRFAQTNEARQEVPTYALGLSSLWSLTLPHTPYHTRKSTVSFRSGHFHLLSFITDFMFYPPSKGIKNFHSVEITRSLSWQEPLSPPDSTTSGGHSTSPPDEVSRSVLKSTDTRPMVRAGPVVKGTTATLTPESRTNVRSRR
jgi:hypothetical protein